MASAKVQVKYSFSVGLWKSFKNTAVVTIGAAVMYLLNNYTEWVPSQYMKYAAFIAGMAAYLVKNWVAMKQ